LSISYKPIGIKLTGISKIHVWGELPNDFHASHNCNFAKKSIRDSAAVGSRFDCIDAVLYDGEDNEFGAESFAAGG
jgi:hypothetical protein